MSISLCAPGSRLAALLAFTVAAASCGGKVVSPEDDRGNDASDQDAAPSVGSGSPPPSSGPNTGTPPTPTPSGVAANCASANVVYANVLDASGTSIMAGPRLFPVQFAYSSSLGTSTDLVELSTFGDGPNGVALTVGGTADNVQPLAIESYVEPPDDSDDGRPFLALVVDGEVITQDGTASGGFAITALAGNSPDGVLEPFSITFDVTITSPKGVAHVIGCGNWIR